jgi:DNA-binding MarR family transcriptional regulator
LRREPFTQESVGRGVARWLETTTSDALSVEEGSLYPALRRPMDRGWVRAEWAISQSNRRARYYTLTERGRAQLEREVSEWERFSGVGREVMSTSDGSHSPDDSHGSGWFRRPRRTSAPIDPRRVFDEEVQHHIEMRVAHNLARGMEARQPGHARGWPRPRGCSAPR